MKRGRDESDPFKEHHLTRLAFLWVRKVDPLIRKCVNKDIVKKIFGYLKIDLRYNGFQLHCSAGAMNTIWFWRGSGCIDYRPCVGCLTPIGRPDDESSCNLICEHCCIHLAHLHRQCCGVWSNSLDSKCFEPFRKIYVLPTQEHFDLIWRS